MRLPAHRLYILSGLAGSGRTAWVRRLLEKPDFKTSVISEMQIRREVLGERPAPGDASRWVPYENQQSDIGAVFRARIEARLAQRLTTFIDGEHLSDADRKSWFDLARRYGVKAEVLIFDDTEEAIRSYNRTDPGGQDEASLVLAMATFTRDSKYPCRRVMDSYTVIEPNRLPHEKIDVVGDVHGLYDLFERLITQLGYGLDATGVPVHRTDPQRKLLLLGDFVDRGPDSVRMLEIAFRMSKAGHFVLIGNHERKLIQYWDAFQAGAPKTRSFSSAQTAMAFMRKEHAARENLIAYLKALPAYYIFEDRGIRTCFTHGNPTYFDPLQTPYAECVYGDNRIHKSTDALSTDRDYSRLFPTWNRYHMIRGHVGQNCEDMDMKVFSLDGNQAFGGTLMGMRLDAMLDGMRQGCTFMTACREAVVAVQSDFNYDHDRASFHFKRALDALVQEGRVRCSKDDKFGLLHYKYRRRIYSEDHFSSDQPIFKTRGLVIDEAGNIVVHPFDKIFNFHEARTTLDLGQKAAFDFIEKINGFQINITRHPFSNTLLVTSNEGFNNPFVEMAQQYIDTHGVFKKALMRHLGRTPGTLIFEVVDRRDPHSMSLQTEEEGWWLIGQRTHERSAPLLDEPALDVLAAELEVRRPARTRGDYAELVEVLRRSTHEGYIVRAVEGDRPILFKIKTPVYLAEKFLGQMSSAKLALLYKDPDSFSSGIDEDLLPVIHELTEKIALQDFVGMPEHERRRAIHTFMVERLHRKTEPLTSEARRHRP